MRSQNGQLLQPFHKLQHTSICSQLERWNLTGSAGDRLEALYTVLHPIELWNCVESQCGRGNKFNSIVSAYTIVMVDSVESVSRWGHRCIVWCSNPAWDKFFVPNCSQPGAALPMQCRSVVSLKTNGRRCGNIFWMHFPGVLRTVFHRPNQTCWGRRTQQTFCEPAAQRSENAEVHPPCSYTCTYVVTRGLAISTHLASFQLDYIIHARGWRFKPQLGLTLKLYTTPQL
jgi:hypothetical protein